MELDTLSENQRKLVMGFIEGQASQVHLCGIRSGKTVMLQALNTELHKRGVIRYFWSRDVKSVFGPGSSAPLAASLNNVFDLPSGSVLLVEDPFWCGFSPSQWKAATAAGVKVLVLGSHDDAEDWAGRVTATHSTEELNPSMSKANLSHPGCAAPGGSANL